MSTRDTVTDAQILKCIRDSVKDRGFPPTVRELGACCGLSSVASVVGRLRRLVKDGLIKMEPNRAGSIRLVEEGKK